MAQDPMEVGEMQEQEVREVSDTSRSRWLDAAKRVLAGERDNLLCPEHGDDNLLVQWIPFESETGGEYWLHCPCCGAQNFILKRMNEGENGALVKDV